MSLAYYSKAFIIGSSLAGTLITFLYMGRAFNKHGCKNKVQYGYIPIMISIMLGLANVVMLMLFNAYPYLRKNRKYSSLVFGSFYGLLFASVGTFIFDFPTKLFLFKTKGVQFLYASIIYSLIFGILIDNTNKIFKL